MKTKYPNCSYLGLECTKLHTVVRFFPKPTENITMFS